MKHSGSKKFSLMYFALVVFGLFLILHSLNLTNNVKDFFYNISEPIQKKLWESGNAFSEIFTRKSLGFLQEENHNLKLKIQQLEVQNVRIFELEQENQFLREALSVGLEKEFTIVMAEIIAKDHYRDFIRINKGQADDIAVGNTVLSHDKVLLGRISEVGDGFSVISLISNTNTIFDAEIVRSSEQSFTSVAGVVKGAGGLQVFLDLIPKDKEVQEEEVVVTSALGGIFPKGLLVGYVKNIQDKDLEPFKKAEINLAFDIKDLKFVFVVK